jgi:hypothetical protein
MKKFNRKTKSIALCLVIAIILIATFAIIRINHARKCHDIIGDGYAMGTDSRPVVIGNTCDK